ncbi:Chromatin modification-related protein [Yarrowia sp. C11]|nr:Chromatin modification-related protein [Yarrowia sp. C11]KAG5370424.1 Chromatin modification-related protein [Yarrowia sp. E02]
MDAASVLDQYVQDLANLPSEVAHILEEVRDKDLKFYETRKRIQQRDNQIHKFIRANGSLADNPKEQAAYPKIRQDFQAAMELQDEKCTLAAQALALVAKHVKKLNDDIDKLDAEGLLGGAPPQKPISANRSRATSSATPAPEPPSRNYTRDRANSRRGVSPAASRSSTPGTRPPKKRATDKNNDAASMSKESSVGASEQLRNMPETVAVGSLDAAIRAGPGEDDEVLYCFCQQPSFGEMVACDNDDCQYEWFHYDCVGLAEPPQGVWFCPSCSKGRKGDKKKR